MVKIACLGWGSLIWDPRDLPIEGKWFENGPLLPIEFVRQSKDGRLTLVIDEAAYPVRTLWALFSESVSDIQNARRALKCRENTNITNIGIWTQEDGGNSPFAEIISDWARDLNLDAVLWTALPPKFNNKNKYILSEDEAVKYLRGLQNDKYELSRDYICNAPKQIDTRYRRRFKREFGW